MLNKCFSFAGVVALGGVVAMWAGCSSDDTTSTAKTDGGTDSTLDSGSTGNTTVDSGSNTSSGGLDGGVTVTYGSCTVTPACGGDLVGNWKVTGGCLDKSTFDDARKSCSSLQESDVSIQAVGTLSFTATQTTRDTTVRLTGNVFIPTNDDQCSAAKGTSCGLLSIGLSTDFPGAPPGLKFDTATCTDTATPSTGCNCAVTKTTTDKASQPYTTSNGVLTTTSPDQTYNYCVNGSSSSYVETTPGQTLKLNVQIGKQ